MLTEFINSVKNKCKSCHGLVSSQHQFLHAIVCFITITSAVVLILTAIIGYYHYGISPVHAFEEIGYKLHQQNYTLHQEDLKENITDFHNTLGIRLLNVKQTGAARNEFNQVLKTDPLNYSAERCLIECDIFNTTPDNYLNSLDCPEITYIKLTTLVDKFPDDPMPYLYLGDFSLKHEQFENASNFYSKSINLSNGTAAAAYYGMGIVYDIMNQPELSREMFEKAVKISYWNVLYRSNLADVYYELKDYKNATVWYNSIDYLNEEPKPLEHYTSLSNSYRCLGNLAAALDIQQKQISIIEKNNPDDLAINNQTVLFYHTNSTSFEPLYTYDMQKSYYYNNIALTYYIMGDEDKALNYWNKANALHLDKKSQIVVKNILNYDIETLQNEQSKNREIVTKTVEFKRSFLNRL